MISTRTCLFNSDTGSVERVECHTAPRIAREDCSPHFQIAFPYRGAFTWQIGGDVVMSDPNQGFYKSC